MTHTITVNASVASTSKDLAVVNLLSIKDLIVNANQIASYSFNFNANSIVDLSHLQIDKLNMLIIKATKPIDISLTRRGTTDIYTGVFGTFFLRLFVGTSALVTHFKVRSGLESGSFDLILGIPLI